MSHREFMEGYYLAVEAWERAAEAATHGYATEMAEYEATNPRPTLRAWMMHRERVMA